MNIIIIILVYLLQVIRGDSIELADFDGIIIFIIPYINAMTIMAGTIKI
jgi:hypothetical protein